MALLRFDREQCDWVHKGRREISEKTATEIIEVYRAHHKWPLLHDKLVELFGADSDLTGRMISSLFKLLENPSERTNLLFQEWQTLFGQAAGTEEQHQSGIIGWANRMGIGIATNEDIPKLFFAIHTYFSLLIKILCVDIVASVRSGNLTLYSDRLAKSEERKKLLEEMEDNVPFDSYNIANFLEGDFFSWYIDHYTPELDDNICQLSSNLSKFEPATAALSPEVTIDLFKHLYQNLVPRQIRHDLGEFYTPEWLAQYTLLRSGFDGNPDYRLLDPCCGSGTFLIQILEMVSEWSKKEGTEVSIVDYLNSRKIIGFDLNPIAVLSAKANLILYLADELRLSSTELNLPVFLADSIYVPEFDDKTNSYFYKLLTKKGNYELSFPKGLVDEPALFRDTLLDVEERISSSQPPKSLDETSIVVKNSVTDFYSNIWELNEQEWNKIWCRVILNRFATVMFGKFDFVVGNPPWVKWSSLPTNYRELVKPICETYGVFSSDTWVGGIETDISTVVTHAAASKWLKMNGILAFLITQTVFQTISAEGFRKFILPDSSRLQVLSVEDMTKIKPFDDAQNQTALMILKKSEEETQYPVPYRIWERKSRGTTLKSTDSLQDVLRKLRALNYEAVPVPQNHHKWLIAPAGKSKSLLSLIKPTGHRLRARKGTTTDFNNIYWVQVLSRNNDFVTVRNNTSGQGHQVEQIEFEIESELVYPLVRGSVEKVNGTRVAMTMIIISLLA